MKIWEAQFPRVCTKRVVPPMEWRYEAPPLRKLVFLVNEGRNYSPLLEKVSRASQSETLCCRHQNSLARIGQPQGSTPDTQTTYLGACLPRKKLVNTKETSLTEYSPKKQVISSQEGWVLLGLGQWGFRLPAQESSRRSVRLPELGPIISCLLQDCTQTVQYEVTAVNKHGMFLIAERTFKLLNSNVGNNKRGNYQQESPY